MQGQEGTIGSLPEILNFDHGSSSSNNPIDQQICWNDMPNPTENQINLLSPSDINIAYVNSVSHGQQNLSRWNLGEPSSSNAQSEVNRDAIKSEIGWSSSVSPRLQGQRHEPTNNLSLDNVNVNVNSVFVRSSNSDVVPQNLNLSAGFVSHGGNNSQVLECPNMYKSNQSQNLWNPSSSSPSPFLLPSGNSGLLVEGSDNRAGSSLDGRRASCKRKTLEGNIGQSSASGHNAGSTIRIPAPLGQVNPRLVLGAREVTSDDLRDSSIAGSSESSRNFRARINPSTPQGSTSHTLFSSGNDTVRHSGDTSSQHSGILLPVEPAIENMGLQGQPVTVHVPTLPRHPQSFRWTNGGSSSRTSNSSGTVGDRLSVPREDLSSRSSITRNILENPIFVPAAELRNLVRNPTNRSLAGENTNIPGSSVASTSRTGPNTGLHPGTAPWVPQDHPSARYPMRLSEYVRRQLFSSGFESPGQTSQYSPLPSGSASTQDVVPSSGAGNLGPVHPRSALYMARQGGSGLGLSGLPYSLRPLTAIGEGSASNRLVAEHIRSVLGFMRRGESIRFEDVMILDQTVFPGVADLHDWYRDMRLDVDNMSYEELLALEERIGNVSNGLSEAIILTHLKQRKYSTERSQLETEPCCICREEYNDGEDLGTLECKHNFHTQCIKQWLMQKNLCPICKTTALPI